MATYTLIPSSLTGGYSTADRVNAYSDTESTDYAQIYVSYTSATSFSYGYLGGFRFSTSGEDVTAVTVKVKAYTSASMYVKAKLMSAPDGIALSSAISLTPTATVYTFTLTADAETVVSYANTLCIQFSTKTTGTQYAYIYGAEVIVETEPKEGKNKVVYGGETLIDLTYDTATAADVASGKIFHLPTGVRVTGWMLPKPFVSSVTKTTTNSGRSVSFSLNKQPSWFVVICYKTNTTARNYRVQHIIYDGTLTETYYTNSSTAGSITSSTTDGSFSYSDGTLTVSVSNNAYFGSALWVVYYL